MHFVKAWLKLLFCATAHILWGFVMVSYTSLQVKLDLGLSPVPEQPVPSLKELQSSGGHLARNRLTPSLHSPPRWTATFCHSAFSGKHGLIPSLCMSILLLKAEQNEVQWGELEEGKQKRQHKKELSCSFTYIPCCSSLVSGTVPSLFCHPLVSLQVLDNVSNQVWDLRRGWREGGKLC